jgi:threonine synthase
VFAGYIAKKMGAPIDQLIVTTNDNDILHRFFTKNDYSKSAVVKTVAPSMDIQVSSNFERLLYLEYDCDGEKVNELMENFKRTGKLKVADDIFKRITETFRSARANDNDIRAEIKRMYEKYEYIVCPHTATGTKAIDKFKREGVKLVVLATASPAKFPDVIVESINISPKLPDFLCDLLAREEKYYKIPNNIDLIKDYIYQKVNS